MVSRFPDFAMACVAAACALLLAAASPSLAQDRSADRAPERTPSPDTPRVGFVVDASTPELDATAAAIRREMAALLPDRAAPDAASAPEGLRAAHTWSLDAPGTSISTVLDSIRSGATPVDVLIGVGLQASHALAMAEALPVPTLAAHGIDADGRSTLHPGARPASLNVVAPSGRVAGNVALLRRLQPYTSPVLLVPQALLAQDPSAADRLASVVAARDSTSASWRVVGVGASARAALAALPASTDAAYVLTPLPLPAGERDRLVAGLNARRIATVVHDGRDLVERGALATRFGTATSPLPRRVALHAVDLLRGTDARTLPTALNAPEQPLVNRETAARLGLDLPTSVLLDANVVGREASDTTAVPLTYAEAVRTAVRDNPGLQAARTGVAARQQDVRTRRSAFLPQVQVEGRARAINEDQAAASFGAQPEYAANGTVSFSQTLYSARDAAGLDVAQKQVEAESAQVDATRRDVAVAVGSAYVGVLRAQDVARIQRDVLALARENLQLAEARRASGQVGRREVLRFETQVSLTRQSVLEAEAGVRVAKNRLKQELALSLDTPVDVAPLSAQDSTLTLNETLFARFGGRRASLTALMQALSQAGLDASDELNALDAQLGAAQRGLRAAKQSYWAPELALVGALDHRAYEDGAGTESLSLPNAPIAVPRPPDTNWNVGLSLTLPLFTGLRRDAEVDRTQAQIQGLRYRRHDVRTRLDEAIRAQTERTAAAYLSLREAEAAADAGAQTLSLVQDAYGSGIADVLDLIDAQDAVLTTRLAEANARRDFLLRLIQTERAVSRIGPLLTDAERRAFRQRLYDAGTAR